MSSESVQPAVVTDTLPAIVTKPIARTRELLAVVLWTWLADIVNFRAEGFAGPAVFFAAAVPLILLARSDRITRRTFWVCAAILQLISLRLAWCGSWLNVVSGVTLLLAVALAASGAFPFVLESFAFGLTSIARGLARTFAYRLPRRANGEPLVSFPASAVFLPILASLIFGAIFTLANPNLQEIISQKLGVAGDFVWGYFQKLSVWEVPFCVAAFLVGAGLMMPTLAPHLFGPREEALKATSPEFRAPLYSAYRNTVITLIVLFGVYLCFEFVTLWRRDFPAGFYYAGYAHQGAAWLTVALALATVMLSWIFSGEMMMDERRQQLKHWAWIWSVANLLLAIAVYNRLMIYVGYNGMTRMRIVGFFGITVVVVGFLLVLYKIRNDRGFWWLIRSQLIALVLTIVAYGLFPVDYFSHFYNVRRVASGYLHPAVMIAVKPIEAEGVLPLIEFAKHPSSDETINAGVLAVLAKHQLAIEKSSRAKPWHWTRFQGSTSAAYHALKENESLWKAYLDDAEQREITIKRFVDYAMKWY